MAAHARLKNEFTEDEKCHNFMSRLILHFTTVPLGDIGRMQTLILVLSAAQSFHCDLTSHVVTRKMHDFTKQFSGLSSVFVKSKASMAFSNSSVSKAQAVNLPLQWDLKHLK